MESRHDPERHRRGTHLVPDQSKAWRNGDVSGFSWVRRDLLFLFRFSHTLFSPIQPLQPLTLLLDDRVVAVRKQLFLDRRSLRAVAKGAYLDVQQFILRIITHYCSVAPLA